jgi:hypothetical protein
MDRNQKLVAPPRNLKFDMNFMAANDADPSDEEIGNLCALLTDNKDRIKEIIERSVEENIGPEYTVRYVWVGLEFKDVTLRIGLLARVGFLSNSQFKELLRRINIGFIHQVCNSLEKFVLEHGYCMDVVACQILPEQPRVIRSTKK